MTSNVSSSSLAKSSTSAKSSSSSANNVYNKNSNQTHRDSFSSIKSGSLSDGSSSSSSSSSTQNGSSSSMTSPSTAYTTSISSCNSIDKPYNNHYYIQPNDIASSTNLLNSTTHDSLSQSNNGNHYNSITSAQQLNSAQSFDFYSLDNKITTTTPLTTSKQFSSQINDDNSSVYSSTQNLGFSASRTPSPISSHLNHNLASFSSQISSQNSSSSRISTHQVNSGLLSSSPASSVNTSATSSTPTFSNTRVQSPISASSSSHVSTPSCESNRTASFNSRLNHLKNGNNSSSNSNVKSSAIPTPPPHPDTKETATIIQHYLRLISENSESRNPNDLYDIKKVIDEGSSAQVFTAHTLDTNEECAIKIVPLTYSLEFIFNEIFILKNLKHPHIVDFKESFVKWDGKTREVWLAMEKCARGDITSRAGRINQREVSRIARHLLLALKHLHQNNVIHRDIKLSNILCCANNDVKLADFGVSSLTSTSTTSMVGTIPYMAPDVVLVGPDRPYDTKVDIWSLGVCILELLTGKAAWGRIRDDVIMDKLRRGEAPYGFQRLSKKADIGWEVVDFLEKCFVKNPENRWDAEKLLEHPFITNSC